MLILWEDTLMATAQFSFSYDNFKCSPLLLISSNMFPYKQRKMSNSRQRRSVLHFVNRSRVIYFTTLTVWINQIKTKEHPEKLWCAQLARIHSLICPTLWEIYNQRGGGQPCGWESRHFAPDLKSNFQFHFISFCLNHTIIQQISLQNGKLPTTGLKQNLHFQQAQQFLACKNVCSAVRGSCLELN